MDSTFWFDAINLGWFIVYTEGSQVNIALLSLKIVFVIVHSVDPDEMPHYAKERI